MKNKDFELKDDDVTSNDELDNLDSILDDDFGSTQSTNVDSNMNNNIVNNGEVDINKQNQSSTPKSPNDEIDAIGKSSEKLTSKLVNLKIDNENSVEKKDEKSNESSYEAISTSSLVPSSTIPELVVKERKKYEELIGVNINPNAFGFNLNKNVGNLTADEIKKYREESQLKVIQKSPFSEDTTFDITKINLEDYKTESDLLQLKSELMFKEKANLFGHEVLFRNHKDFVDEFRFILSTTRSNHIVLRFKNKSFFEQGVRNILFELTEIINHSNVGFEQVWVALDDETEVLLPLGFSFDIERVTNKHVNGLKGDISFLNSFGFVNFLLDTVSKPQDDYENAGATMVVSKGDILSLVDIIYIVDQLLGIRENINIIVNANVDISRSPIRSTSEMKYLVERVVDKKRFGFLISNISLFTMGYSVERDLISFLDDFSDLVGIEYLKVLYLTNSRGRFLDLNSKEEKFTFVDENYNKIMDRLEKQSQAKKSKLVIEDKKINEIRLKIEKVDEYVDSLKFDLDVYLKQITDSKYSQIFIVINFDAKERDSMFTHIFNVIFKNPNFAKTIEYNPSLFFEDDIRLKKEFEEKTRFIVEINKRIDIIRQQKILEWRKLIVERIDEYVSTFNSTREQLIFEYVENVLVQFTEEIAHFDSGVDFTTEKKEIKSELLELVTENEYTVLDFGELKEYIKILEKRKLITKYQQILWFSEDAISDLQSRSSSSVSLMKLINSRKSLQQVIEEKKSAIQETNYSKQRNKDRVTELNNALKIGVESIVEAREMELKKVLETVSVIETQKDMLLESMQTLFKNDSNQKPSSLYGSSNINQMMADEETKMKLEKDYTDVLRKLNHFKTSVIPDLQEKVEKAKALNVNLVQNELDNYRKLNFDLDMLLDNLSKDLTRLEFKLTILEEAIRKVDVVVDTSIAINIKDVSVYSETINGDILKNINLVLKKGTITVLVGPSGAGKTSIIGLINREIFAKNDLKITGKILIDNRFNALKLVDEYNDFDTLTSDEYSTKKVGTVYQKPRLIPTNIWDNVTYGPKINKILDSETLKEIATETLETVNLYSEINGDFMKKIDDLSGGQQQRLSIAKAISIKPSILLLDEPTSALDNKSVSIVEDLLVKLKNQYTLVFVSHSLQQAYKLADRVIYMEKGQIVEQGSKSILLKPKTEQLKDFLGDFPIRMKEMGYTAREKKSDAESETLVVEKAKKQVSKPRPTKATPTKPIKESKYKFGKGKLSKQKQMIIEKLESGNKSSILPSKSKSSAIAKKSSTKSKVVLKSKKPITTQKFPTKKLPAKKAIVVKKVPNKKVTTKKTTSKK